MSNLANKNANEQIKLFANSINSVGVLGLVSAVLVPSLTGVGGPQWGWLPAALFLHVLAWSALGCSAARISMSNSAMLNWGYPAIVCVLAAAGYLIVRWRMRRLDGAEAPSPAPSAARNDRSREYPAAGE